MMFRRALTVAALVMGFAALGGTANAACTSPAGSAGNIAWASNISRMVYCDGNNWVTLGSSDGSGGGGADNLGNHTATQALDMATFNINNGGTITGSGGAFGGLNVTGASSQTTISTSLIQVGNGLSAACSGSLAGSMRYSSTSNTMEYCNSTAWVSMGLNSPAYMLKRASSQSGLTNGTVLQFANVTASYGSDITAAGNQITVGPGSYKLEASVRVYSSTSGVVDYIIYDVTNGMWVGTTGSAEVKSTGYSDAPAIAMVSPVVSTTYEVRAAGVGGTTVPEIVASYGGFSAIKLGGGSSGGGGASMLSGLSDVNTSGASTGSILAYNGASWVVSSTAAAGASALASLTDVTLTNLAGRDYLRYDSVAGKWVNISESAVMSTTTMVPKWPDALVCQNGGAIRTLYSRGTDTGGSRMVYQVPWSSDWRVEFNLDGTYNTHTGMSSYDCVSNTWSISALYAQGRAFNFIGNSGASGDDALGDRITSGTLAMVANSATSYVSLSTNGTTWGYLSSVASHLPTLSAAKVSSTNISTSLVQVGNTGVACNAGLKGAIRYSDTSSTLEYCNSSTWMSVGPSDTMVTGSAYRWATQQSIPNATWTVVTLDGERWDTAGMVDIGAQPQRVTIAPGQQGYYLVVGKYGVSANNTGGRWLWMTVNGSGGTICNGMSGAMDGGYSNTCTYLSYLNAGDYLGLSVYQNSGGALDLQFAEISAVKLSAGGGSGGGGGSDNLGNHTATQALDMGGFNINNGGSITGTGGAFGGLTVTGASSLTTVSTSLIQVGTGLGAACTSSISGSMRYSSVSSTMEYCNSNAWVSMGPSDTVPISFRAYKSTDQTVTAGVATKVTYDQVVHNHGGGFSNSTSAFTAPIAGVYAFAATVYCRNGTTYCIGSFRRNGANALGTSFNYTNEGVINTTTIAYLNAGETVEFHGTNGNGTRFASGGNDYFFAGSLIGPQGGGGGGSSDLAGLTDVQLTNLAGRDYLRYDSVAGKWLNISASTVMSTTTMVPGWPDAIRCGVAGSNVVMYQATESGGVVGYRVPQNPASANDYIISFSSNGAYLSNTNMSGSDCLNQSIGQLYAAGQAFNFIGNSGASGDDALGDRITSGTLAMVANSATSSVSLSTNGTTWGYLSSVASYLPTLVASRVSSTLVSSTYVQLSSATEVLSCSAARAGTLRYVSGSMQFCDDNAWKSLAGVGQYAQVTGATQNNISVNGRVAFSNKYGSSLVSLDAGTGRITLKAGAMYKLTGSVRLSHTSPAGSIMNLQWYNVTNSSFFGPAMTVESADTNIASSSMQPAIGYISPSVDTEVELRFTWLSSAGDIDILVSAASIDVVTTLSGGSGGASALGDLTDVSVAGATNGQILTYSGGTWIASDSTVGSSALGDRITSGTLAMVANSATSSVSLSTNGTTWGYFNSGLSYLPAIATGRVSATNISGTLIQVGDGNGATCDAGRKGAIRYSNTSSTVEYCNSTAWVSMGPSATTVPMFAVHRNGVDQTLSSEVGTTINWTSKEADSNNNFDLSTDRFTPTVPGLYLLTANIHCDTTNWCVVGIRKNGVSLMEGWRRDTVSMGSTATLLVTANGTTDYFDAFAWVSGTKISGLASYTNFRGALISMAGGGSGGGSDNLGDHTATQNLDMATFNISNGGTITGSGAAFGGLNVTGASSQTTISTSLVQVGAGMGAACGSNLAGAIRYNISSNTLQVCNSAGWVSLASGTTGDSALGDRIVSGTSNVIVGQNQSVTISTNNQQRMVVGEDGRVGIGTATPAATLDVGGVTHSTLQLGVTLDSDDTVGVSIRRPLTAAVTAAALQFCNPGAGPACSYIYQDASLGGVSFKTNNGNYADSALMHMTSDGKFGIGVLTPTTALTVSGSISASSYIRAGSSGEACASGLAGAIRYSSPNLQYCNGSAWTGLATGSSGDYVLKAGDTMTGRLANTGALAASQAMATASTYLGAFEARSQGSGGTAGAAFIAFHRPSAYAVYFGIDTDDQLKIGGWSMGGNAYKVWHANNDGSGSGLDADLLDGLNSATAGTASTIAARDGSGNLTAAAFLYSSDQRLKKSIIPLAGGLAKLDAITPVAFTFVSDTTDRQHLGVIAQEVEKVYPQAVITADDGYKKVDYPALVPVLIGAVKELKAANDEQRAEGEKLREIVNSYRALQKTQMTDNGLMREQLIELRAANDNLARRLKTLEARKAASE